MTERLHELLHNLWTKAVGTPNYNKKLWIELQQILDELLNRH